MSFGISKCAKLSFKRGKIVQTGPLPVLNGSEIPELDIAGLYRYLGFPEGGGIHHSQSKEIVLSEFKTRLKLIWSSLLHARFKVQATNTFCVPLLLYGFGIVEWTEAEISRFDVLVRKAMVASNSLHPRSAVERLYLPHCLGGRGLSNVDDLYRRRVIMLACHLKTSDDDLVRMCYLLDTSLPPRKSVCSRANAFVSTMSLDIDLAQATADEVKNVVCDRQKALRWDVLKDKPLHGKFVNWCCSGPIDLSKSFYWLKEFFHSESESSIFAIQDQVVRTRVYETKIMHVPGPTVMCRLCNSHEETIQHLMAGCPTLAPTSYLHRHNLVAGVIHWHLCRTFGIHTAARNWFSYKPLPVVENAEIKILWDFGVITVSRIESNRPDIVVFLKEAPEKILLIEVSCPADTNVPDKEFNKVGKYQRLAGEMSRTYHQDVVIVPVVFGVSGIVSKQQRSHLEKIPAFNDVLFANLQKAAILGTVDVLRNINLYDAA